MAMGVNISSESPKLREKLLIDTNVCLLYSNKKLFLKIFNNAINLIVGT